MINQNGGWVSIDLEIFPTRPQIISWRQIVEPLRELLGLSADDLLGAAPSLVVLKTHTVLEPSQPMSVNASYYLNLAVRTTLGITLMPNQGNVDEVNYLEDYGRNLDPDFIRYLAEQWQAAGHYYGIESLAGRNKQEPLIFVALAAAIARACQGYIILMNDDIFDLDVGIYTPEQFRKADPRF